MEACAALGGGPGADPGVVFSFSESVASVSELSGLAFWESHSWARRGRGKGPLTFPFRQGRGHRPPSPPPDIRRGISWEDPTGHMGSQVAQCPQTGSHKTSCTVSLPGAGRLWYAGDQPRFSPPPGRPRLHPHGGRLCSPRLSFPVHRGGKLGSRKLNSKRWSWI